MLKLTSIYDYSLISTAVLCDLLGDSMAQSAHCRSLEKLTEALLTLQELGVSVRGPFLTPKQKHIYVVGQCVLVESEIVDLYGSGKFSANTIGGVLSDLERNQTIPSNMPLS
jgi:hypothetical protein